MYALQRIPCSPTKARGGRNFVTRKISRGLARMRCRPRSMPCSWATSTRLRDWALRPAISGDAVGGMLQQDTRRNYGDRHRRQESGAVFH